MVLSSAISHVASVAGGISMRVLYCFGGGAARRVGFSLAASPLAKIPCGFAAGFARLLRGQKVPWAQESRQLRQLYPLILKRALQSSSPAPKSLEKDSLSVRNIRKPQASFILIVLLLISIFIIHLLLCGI